MADKFTDPASEYFMPDGEMFEVTFSLSDGSRFEVTMTKGEIGFFVSRPRQKSKVDRLHHWLSRKG